MIRLLYTVRTEYKSGEVTTLSFTSKALMTTYIDELEKTAGSWDSVMISISQLVRGIRGEE